MSGMSNEYKVEEEVVVSEPKELTFGESINFKQLFRIKGKKEIYFSITQKNKSGVIGMCEFLGDKKCSVTLSDIESLDVVFHKYDGSEIKMSEVFDNLDREGLQIIQECKSIAWLMEIICPGFDSDLFKEYHAEKVIKWFIEIKTKINSKSETNK